MKQEDKVCSLEQAKILDELIENIETEKVWLVNEDYYNDPKDAHLPICEQGVVCHEQATLYKSNFSWLDDPPEYDKSYAAPDVAELGELLPVEIKIYKKQKFNLYDVEKHNNNVWIFYKTSTYFDTEAQARCAALIWLIENNYLKPDEIKL